MFPYPAGAPCFAPETLPFRAAAVIRGAKSAAIAQLVEHIIRNDGVGGSNPSCGTIRPKHRATHQNISRRFGHVFKSLVVITATKSQTYSCH